MACPNATFAKRRVLGKTFDVSCGTGCGCAIQGTCTNGTMTFYADDNCTGSSFTMVANGTCQSSPGSGPVASYKYTATINGAACTASGTSTATASVTELATLCCE